jgi:hypothetical protein
MYGGSWASRTLRHDGVLLILQETNMSKDDKQIVHISPAS